MPCSGKIRQRYLWNMSNISADKSKIFQNTRHLSENTRHLSFRASHLFGKIWFVWRNRCLLLSCEISISENTIVKTFHTFNPRVIQIRRRVRFWQFESNLRYFLDICLCYTVISALYSYWYVNFAEQKNAFSVSFLKSICIFAARLETPLSFDKTYNIT